MHNKRKSCLARELEMPAEIILLHVERRVIPVAIQPRLAQADDFAIRRQAAHAIPIIRRHLRRVVRMDAGRGINLRMPGGEIDDRGAGIGRDGDTDDRLHAVGESPA